MSKFLLFLQKFLEPTTKLKHQLFTLLILHKKSLPEGQECATQIKFMVYRTILSSYLFKLSLNMHTQSNKYIGSVVVRHQSQQVTSVICDYVLSIVIKQIHSSQVYVSPMLFINWFCFEFHILSLVLFPVASLREGEGSPIYYLKIMVSLKTNKYL